MADHGATFEVFYDGAWHPAPVLTRDGFSVMRGAKTPGNDTDPGGAELTIDNTSGMWAPKSVLSPLYGKIGQNTPGRASLDGDVRLTGEVASWKPQRPVKGSGYTPIELGGVLRRIGRGTDSLRSPLTRAALAAGPVDWWSLEDGRNATSGANLVSGGAAAVVPAGLAGPTFSGLDDTLVPAGLSALPAFNSGVLTASARGTSTSSWRIEFVVCLEANSANSVTYLTPFQWTTGGGIQTWQLDVLDTSAAFHGYSPFLAGTPFFSTIYDFGVVGVRLDDGIPHHFVLDVSQTNSTTMAFSSYVDGVLVSSGTNGTGAVIGQQQVGAPRSWTANPLVSSTVITVGAVGFWSPHPVSPVSIDAYYGYDAETAAARFVRFCDEEGIDDTVIGQPSETAIMGPQTTDPLLEQLDLIARTDDASIFETRDSSGLTMRTGASKLNQDAALVLSYLGQVVPPLRPVFGDVGIRNDVTATNPDNSSGRVTQETGPHNVQLPEDDPQGVGRYTTSVAVNLWDNASLVDAAGWRVNLGTYDGTAYAAVEVDLDAAPGLIAAVNAVDVGDVVQITSLPIEDSIGDFYGIVLGIEDKAPAKRRTVVFYLVPADPYRVGILAQTTGDTDPVVGYAETDLTTTAASIAAGASSFTANASPLWTTLADDFPQDIVMGGQRVTLGSVTGASNPQTFTVRSAALGGRQILYPVASGASITVYQPLIMTM